MTHAFLVIGFKSASIEPGTLGLAASPARTFSKALYAIESKCSALKGLAGRSGAPAARHLQGVPERTPVHSQQKLEV